MVSYKDLPFPRESGSLDNVEMQEREEDYPGEQEERLLSGADVEATGDITYKVEWHLRTGWAIAGSVLVTACVFLSLVFFTKLFIVSDNTNNDPTKISGIGSFRRPASDYVLDPAWNLNAVKQVREYKWTIMDIVGNPDGVFRPMLTINGQFPGPMVECNEGDTLIIEVDNQSVNATSLHFHGIFQNGTNWMDGTTGVTQCPLAPKRKFRYEFTVNGQSGTYYYHGHQAVQASDGLYGPLVIHSRDEKKLQQIPYASDRVVMLQDYYHDLSSGLLVSALEPGSESSPIPNGALINGLNRRDCSELPHRMCDNSTTSLPSFDLVANANHRLRFINVGAFAWFQVTVDEHEFAITETDGTDIVPAYDSRLMISPAQRYSMVINTNQTTTDSFWLRAKMVTHCWKEPELPGPGADEVKAILHYTPKGHAKSAKALISQPNSRNWSQGMEVQCKDMNTTSYVPAVFDPAPSMADHSYYIRSNLEIGDWRLERGFFNTSTFRPNLQQPTLHRSVEGLSSTNETFNAMRSADGVNSECYDLKHDFVIQHTGIKVVDLVIQNFDEGNHPMHLHGHKFWVLGQGHGMFPGYEALGLQLEGKGVLAEREGVLDSLIRRDVATAEGFGWLALRFIADNPGVWAFHCHMAWHSEAGLVMQFLSRVDEVATWEIPKANRQLCEASLEELEKGAAPKDSTWFGFGIGG
jgi:FtsP/CotA-like multicopper oxidase with cupredoxin domain